MPQPISAIRIAARALSFYERVQEATSNNLANVDTEGFKSDRIVAILNGGDRAPVAGHAVDFRTGPIRETGQALDLALTGPGYLVLDTPGQTTLTRGGTLGLDSNGVLVAPDGTPVLGHDGPIIIDGSDVAIARDGSVEVDGRLVGRLRVVDAPEAGLTKAGVNRFQSNQALDQLAISVTEVRQGAIEGANTDPITGLVDMIQTERAYGANHSSMRALDGVMNTIANSLGRIG